MDDHLATLDMGRKEGAAVAPWGARGPHLTQCGLGQCLQLYQVASWSIQPFCHNTCGLKIGGAVPLWGELCPYVTQCGRDRGLLLCQVSSWSIQPFCHNTPSLQTGQDRRSPNNKSVNWRKPITYSFPVWVSVGWAFGAFLVDNIVTVASHLAAGYWYLEVYRYLLVVLVHRVRFLPLFRLREILVAVDTAALILSHGHMAWHASDLIVGVLKAVHSIIEKLIAWSEL